MARFQFPGKPAKFSVKKTRVLSCKSRENGDRMVNVERTGRYLADFYTMVGDSDEDEDACVHGFSSVEVDRARDIYTQLASQADDIREEVWLARGVLLDRKDRASIQEHAAKAARHSSTTRREFDLPAERPESQAVAVKPKLGRPFGTFKVKPTAVKSQHRHSEPAKLPGTTVKNTKLSQKKEKIHTDLPVTAASEAKQTRKSSSTNKRKSSTRTLKANEDPVGMGDCGGDDGGRSRVQIEIPSWRRVEDRLGAGDWRRLDGVVEDATDQVYMARHAKAESEEQVLWEKWQIMRAQAGKKIKGRSKSRGWREVLLPSRLRASRVSSLDSEDSFSGRLTPRTGQLEEIQVVTAPPTPLPEDEQEFQHSVHLSSNHFISKDCDMIDMPLSPPLSPVHSSVVINEPVSTTTRRKSNSAESVKKEPLLVNALRPALETLKQRQTAKSHLRLSGSGSKKRLTTPAKVGGREKTGRVLYPLRSLSSPRKTRLGARR